MKNKRRAIGSSSKTDANSQARTVFPVMLEPVLQSHAGELSERERRELARIYERWAAQLLCSAEVIKRYAPSVDEYSCAVKELGVDNVPSFGEADLLRLAARLDEEADRIRKGLGLEHCKPLSPDRLPIIFPN
jgi:hypothetical protein